MAASPKQVNGNTLNNNSALGKRKKSSNKCSYLSKWLDKTMHHIQEATPSMDTYDSFDPNLNWPMSNTHAPPGFDPYRFMYAQEPMSLPTLPTYYSNIPFYNPECRYVQSVNKSVQVQRPRYRRRSEKAEEIQVTPNGTLNSTLSNANYLQPKNFTDNQDFASLPPIVTSVGDTTSNSDMNAIDKDVGSGRRYSDPCVQGLPDIARPANGDAESGSETSSDLSGSQVGSRLLSYLLDQITSLKITNERLNKELLETKAELQNVRHQHTIWQKSTTNIGTPNHSPLNSNGLINGQYSPGVLTDLVREIRDAARIREEAMFSRVRSMIIERTDNGLAPAETKYTEKALEEIKSSLRATEGDRRHMMDRIMKLEDEIRSIRISNSLESNENGAMNGSTEETEAERMRLRKELSDMRKAKQNAEEHTIKLERLVTQLRSKFNSHQMSTNGPESLPSENEHEIVRARRTSVNSSNNSTVVFGPVTDL